MTRAASTASRTRPRPPLHRADADGPGVSPRQAVSRFDADRHGLTATFVWDSGDGPGRYDAVVRVCGRRLQVVGRRAREDDFVREEQVHGIVPGSGPVSLTTRVHGINAGEWSVTAELTTTSAHARVGALAGQAKQRAVRQRLARGEWSWRRWTVRPAAPTAICTRRAPLTGLDSAPAVLPGSYAALIAAGVLLGLVVQARLVARGLDPGHVLVGSLLALAAGVVGAKLWYRADRAGRKRASGAVGWCIQGFLAGAALALTVSVWAFGLPVGTVLDATAPALFLGLGVGRLGCFFIGCCAGRPSASRWAVWSSDRRIGARRIPAQPLESLSAAVIGLVAWRLYRAAPGAGGGAVLVGGFAAYTLARQLLLRLRAAPRTSSRRGILTAGSAAVALLAAVVILAT